MPTDPPHSRWKLLRWSISTATLNVPQAGGPIAFSLAALALTGDTRGGAAMMLAMTLAQVAGAVPLARLARRLPVATCLRLLIAFRTLTLLGVALAAKLNAPSTSGPRAERFREIREQVEKGVDPRYVGELVREAIENDWFYIFTDTEHEKSVDMRFGLIKQGFDRIRGRTPGR